MLLERLDERRHVSVILVRMAEMATPAKRWEGSEKLSDSSMYLSAVPSGVPPAPRNAGSL